MYRLFCMLPLAALLLCLFGAAGCGGGDDDELGSGSELNPKDTVPEIEVYAVDFRYRTTFHNNPWGYSQLPYNSDPALPLLRTASSSLDLAIPRLSRQELVDALLQLAQAGVAVRIVTELDSYQDAAQKAFFDQLEAGPTTNIQIRTDTDALPRQMGCRFFIIDKLQVVCSSFPFESSEYDQSMGDVILIRDPDVAQSAFSVVFDDMFNGRFGREKYPAIQHNFMLGQGDAALEVYFLPNDDFTTLMTRELNLANVVLVSQQQWGDTALAGSLGTWLASTIPPNSLFGQRVLGVMINDTSEDPLSVTDANPNQDIWERSVDEYFTTLLSNPEEGGQTILTGMPVPHYDGLFYYGFPLGRDIYGALPYDHSYALDTVMGHNFVIFEQAQFHLNSDVPTGGIQGLRPLFNNWQTLDSAVL